MNGNDGVIRDHEKITESREKRGSAGIRAASPQVVPEGAFGDLWRESNIAFRDGVCCWKQALTRHRTRGREGVAKSSCE